MINPELPPVVAAPGNHGIAKHPHATKRFEANSFHVGIWQRVAFRVKDSPGNHSGSQQLQFQFVEALTRSQFDVIAALDIFRITGSAWVVVARFICPQRVFARLNVLNRKCSSPIGLGAKQCFIVVASGQKDLRTLQWLARRHTRNHSLDNALFVIRRRKLRRGPRSFMGAQSDTQESNSESRSVPRGHATWLEKILFNWLSRLQTRYFDGT